MAKKATGGKLRVGQKQMMSTRLGSGLGLESGLGSVLGSERGLRFAYGLWLGSPTFTPCQVSDTPQSQFGGHSWVMVMVRGMVRDRVRVRTIF